MRSRTTARRAIMLLAVIGAALTVMAASGTARTKSQSFTVGYSALQLTAPPFQQALRGLKSAGPKYQYNVIAADAKLNALTQLHQIQAWLNTKRVQAIDIVPVDVNALVPALRQAAKMKVPVVITTFPKGFRSPYLASVTFSWLEYGHNAGRGAVDCIRSRLGGKANVAILEPTIFPGLISDRIKGVKAELAKLPGAKVVAEVGPSDDQAKALANVSTALRAHPDIDTLVAVDSDDGLGGLKAVQQAGRDPKKMCIQSSDYVPEAKAEVKSGNFWGDVRLPVEKSAPLAGKVLASLRRNPHSPYRGKQLYVPTQLIETSAK